MTAIGRPLLANPDHVAATVVAGVMKPPPPVDLERWAVENIEFPDGSPVPGRYNLDRFPFFREVLAVLSPQSPTREVVLAKSAQIGGTLLSNIFLGGMLDMAPSGALYTQVSEANATRWARTKWRPFVRETAALSAAFPPLTGKEAGATLLYYERVDGRGFLQASGANSEASLAMITVRYQVQDDLSKWEENRAGDPEGQADSRSKADRRAKILKISTPMLADNCRITRAYERGSRKAWQVPCPACGHYQVLDPELFIASIEGDDPTTAHFPCVACKHPIRERDRDAIIGRGRWVAGNPTMAGIAESYWIWAAYAPLEDWTDIARGWLNAKKSPETEQTWWNDTAGIAYKAASETPPWEDLLAREPGHSRGRVPADHLIISIGIDCQVDRVEWQAIAHGPNQQRFVIDCGVIAGDISGEDTQRELDKLVLTRTWPLPGGGRYLADRVAIDANYMTDEVLAWARRHPTTAQPDPTGPRPHAGVIMVRGVPGDGAPALTMIKSETDRRGRKRRYGTQRFFNVGVSRLKIYLYQCLKLMEPLARGHIAFCDGLEEDYFRQLCAERRTKVRDRRTGYDRMVWMKVPGQRNEVLDTAIYAAAAAIHAGWTTWTDEAWERRRADRAASQPDLETLMTAQPALPAAEPPKAAAAPEPARSWIDRLA